MALFKRSKKAAPGKGAAAKKPKPPRGARIKQIRTAFKVTRAHDPKVLPLTLAAFFGPFLLLLAIGFVVGRPFIIGSLGFMIGMLLTAFVFGRRVQRTAYSQVEGQLGAAAAILNGMRGDWRVTPAVGVTRDQDLVHRVLGRPGVVLVSEGARNRTRNLVVTEKKRVSRVIGDTPVYDVHVGDDEGSVPLRQLEKHFTKLPRNIKPRTVNELDRRLKALGTAALPIPKGPMPRGGRVPRGKVR